MKKLRVLIADDHALVRTGIRALVETLDGVEVVAETGDGVEALALIDRYRPDIVLMDITMPRLSGLEATARIVREHPEVHVIVLSRHASEEYVWQALRAGAAGYVLKDAGLAELDLAIRAAARGEKYLSPTMSRHVVDGYVRGLTPELSPLERLTSRQREILQLVAEGQTTKEIAGKLNLAVKTVETHRGQLMSRLDIHDIAGLVRYAIRVGLITSDI
jgi:DNA-binding NarL/FixJ family response regulator